MTTEILVLAAGNIDFDRHDGGYPLCLAEFDGMSLLERILSGTRLLTDCRYTFAVRRQEVAQFHLDSVISLLSPDARVVQIEETTRGSACTALMAASQFDPSHELLIISANEWLNTDYHSSLTLFRKSGWDGAVFVFSSIHPRYSYVSLDARGYVVEAAQRRPISRHATAGSFWFARTGDFVEAVKSMIRKDARVENNFYIAPAFNELVLRQRKIGTWRVAQDQYHPLKSERQLHQFETGEVH